MSDDTTPAKVLVNDELGANAQDVLRELDDATNQTWAGKRRRWASFLRAQDAEIARLTHALAQSGKLAEDRLQQMKTDRAQALRWRAQLDHATEDGSAGKGTGRHIAEFVLDPPQAG